MRCYYITNDKTIKIHGVNHIVAITKMLGYCSIIPVIQNTFSVSSIIAVFIINGVIIAYKTL